MRFGFAVVAIGLILTGCSKDGEKTEVDVSAKLRSTGVKGSGLWNTMAGDASFMQSVLANSDTDIEYFKVPISRINLVADLGKSSSGYSSASPDFYACNGTDLECSVNLMDSSLDNLLTSDGSATVEFEGSEEYNGIAVEHCGNGGPGQFYQALIKGQVNLGGTIYYTNAATGLSDVGPAEETTIAMPCMGSNSYLLEPVTLEEGGSLDIVLYADPSANLFATTSKAAVNSNCTGVESLAICANNVSVFGTVDSAKPTVERYLLATGGAYSDIVVSLLLNSADAPFGALMSQYFTNSSAERLMHTPTFSLSQVAKNADDTYNLNYYQEGGTVGTVIANFKRGAHSGTIDALVNASTAYDAAAF